MAKSNFFLDHWALGGSSGTRGGVGAAAVGWPIGDSAVCLPSAAIHISWQSRVLLRVMVQLATEAMATAGDKKYFAEYGMRFLLSSCPKYITAKPESKQKRRRIRNWLRSRKHKSINQSINQSLDQPTNQSVDPSTNQSIDRSIAQPRLADSTE